MCEFRVLEEEWIAQWCDSDETTIGCQPVGCQQVSKWDFDLPWIGRIRRQPSAVTVTPFRAELINTNFLSGRWISCENRWASCERNNDVIPESRLLTHVLLAGLVWTKNTLSWLRPVHRWTMRLVSSHWVPLINYRCCWFPCYNSMFLLSWGCVSWKSSVFSEKIVKETRFNRFRLGQNKSNDANENANWIMISKSFQSDCVGVLSHVHLKTSL